MKYLELSQIRVDYGEGLVVDDLNLGVDQGEMMVLLGESGCGKSTTLRVVAGLVRPVTGSVIIAGEDISTFPPWRREIGFVFQHHALFPHLTVEQNVEYGLDRRSLDRSVRRARVQDVLELVGMSEFAHRKPAALSGGQAQRVALARALAPSPRVLLLDEPFSSLDIHLAERLREEVTRIIRSVGVTSILVTHNQVEALVMADRIAVMQSGRIVEQATAEGLYRSPTTAFAAHFLGRSNVIYGRIEKTQSQTSRSLFIGGGFRVPLRRAVGSIPSRCAIAVKPEDIAIQTTGSTAVWTVKAEVVRVLFVGADHELLIRVVDDESENTALLRIRVHGRVDIPPMGETIAIWWPEDAMSLVAIDDPPSDSQLAGLS